MRNSVGLPQGKAAFKPVVLGGGGFVTGFDQSADGVTSVCRTDVYGGHIKTTGDKTWRQLFTASTLAVGDCPGTTGYTAPSGTLVDNTGVYEIRVAPNNNQILYAVWNARVWKSTNAGQSWTHLTAIADILALTNSGPQPHNCGHNMVIDPQNASVMLLGTQANGLYYTTNGGTTFTNVALGANASLSGYQVPSKVACDPTGTVTGSIKQRWFAVRQGTGVYVSTTGPGGPYTLMTGSPTYVGDMTFDTAGNCWAVDPTNNGSSTSNLWKCAAGGTTWAQGPGGAPTGIFIVTIACDPINAGRIVCLSDQSYAIVSNNSGAAWLGSSGAGYIYFSNYPSAPTINAWSYSIPWLGGQKNTAFNPGMARFDKTASNLLHCTSGVGMYECHPPSVYDTTSASQFNWVEKSEGIENLVANPVVEPIGGAPLFAVWDRGFIRMANLDKSSPEGPQIAGGYGAGVEACWSLSSAYDNPNYVVSLTNFNGQHSGYSTDAGKTVTKFATDPPQDAGNGGCIVTGTQNNILIIQSTARPVYSKDNGATWNYVNVTGMPTTGNTGFGAAYFVKRINACYDGLAGKYYMTNSGDPNWSAGVGIWSTADLAGTWSHVKTTALWAANSTDSWHTKLRWVPGHQGHFLAATGVGYPDSLLRSTDGCVTFAAVTGVSTVVDFEFGPPAAGQSFPSVWFYGTVGGVQGLYRSDDYFATTPKLIAQFPGNLCDQVYSVGASPNKYGRVYVGFAGSGFVYGDYDCPVSLS